jgi:hypothetical protein
VVGTRFSVVGTKTVRLCVMLFDVLLTATFNNSVACRCLWLLAALQWTSCVVCWCVDGPWL